MSIKRFVKYYILGESLKEIEANRILDKINKNSKLSSREEKFLDLYNHVVVEFKDFMYISKNVASSKIEELLKLDNITIICDLHDKDGRIGLPIIDLLNNKLILKDKSEHLLHDRFLYNLIYNSKKNEYSLQEQDEYFEKIEVNRNEN